MPKPYFYVALHKSHASTLYNIKGINDKTLKHITS